MKKSQKLLSVLGLLGAPLVGSLLVPAVPQISLILFSLIFLGGGPFLLSLGLLVILGAAIAPLLFGPQDPPFSAFVFTLL